ncbi:MAG: nitroreductase [Lautropia sp.]|nr:nitroreductase [Lautropia sp.]
MIDYDPDLEEAGEIAIAALLGRFSVWPLVSPAPSAGELAQAFDLAMRAPDHGHLQPWRFLTVRDEARADLAGLLVEAARARGHDDPERYRKKPMAAPLTIVAAVRLTESPKVPEIEQWLAAGAAVMNLLNGLYLLGYGAIWVTGPNTFDPAVRDALGFGEDEQLLGFIHVGTPEPGQKRPERACHSGFVREWQGRMAHGGS